MLKKAEKEQLKVPAHIDYLGDLRDFVTHVGKKHGFADKIINAFKLSIDEAATNIIRHAYRDGDGLITIRAIVKRNSLTISILDQGTYFDPKRVKDPDLNRYIDIGKKGGLGIFIMRRLMDEIDYRRTEEGNELRITKYREAPEKKKLVSAVTSIPLSIKAKFFFRTASIITLIISIGYLYYFQKVDNIVITEFITSARETISQIINRISSASAEDFEFVEDVVHPVYEDYKNKILHMSIEDSTGTIVYSTNLGELFNRFSRPDEFEGIDRGIYKYSLGKEGKVYEFENVIVIKNTGRVYGKSHILVSAENTEKLISTNRLTDLKLAFFILGASYVGIALLIYLLMNPLHKLSEWIKELGHGEIDDEIDIDASSEIGEIAQAFSDITQKFRESQRHLVDQERLQKEMQVAQDIQQTLLPMEFPELEGYELASYYEAAKEVGGDYYDFVEVDKDTLGIAVADVSGKGIPGSLVMTMIRTTLRTEARGIKDAAEVLTRVNTAVSSDIKKGMFVTVFYLIIDSKKRSINYASAGHNPMILYRGSTKQTYYLNPKGFPIGIQLPQKDLFRQSIESDTIQLTKDDILLVYTDGITEAMNSKRDLFGEEQLLKVLRSNGHLDVNEFVERLKTEIYSFTEGNPQNDDISFVAIKEKTTREEDELRRAKEAQKLISEGMSIREACETINLTAYAYYNKYKKVFEEEGMDAFEIDEEVSVEAKHLSIEEKTKIFDIIAKHPEYGASRISDELKTDTYNFTNISESKIYDELVRSKLNTRQLREAYISKIKKSNRKFKPPGTPLMTLDGKIIIDHKWETDYTLDTRPPSRIIKQKQKDEIIPEQDLVTSPEIDSTIESLEPSILEEESDNKRERKIDSEIEADSLLDVPIDELLSKEHTQEQDSQQLTSEDMPAELPEEADVAELAASEPSTTTEESITDSNRSEIGSEFNTEDLNAEQLPESSETSLLGDFSIEKFFEESSAFGEETFDEGEEEDEEYKEERTEKVSTETTTEESPANIVSQFEENPENDVPVQEESINAEVQNQAVDESLVPSEQEEDLTFSSVDELFNFERDNESKVASEISLGEFPSDGSEKEKKTEEKKEESISFADLIQAIDDEIVYVTDKAGNTNIIPTNNTPGNEKGEQKTSLVDKDDKHNTSRLEQQAEKTAQTENSIEKLEKSNPKITDKEKKLIKGIKYYKDKEYKKAITEFKKVIEIYPDYKEAHSILGNAYFRNDMYDEAALAYNSVKKIDPEDIAAYENMGVIYANRGDFKLAIAEWKKVLELSPKRTDIESKIKKALQMI